MLCVLNESTWGRKETKLEAVFTNIGESRFNAGMAWPRCKSKDVLRYGPYKERQRYKCKSGGRTDNDLTHSPLSGTWYVDRTIKFFSLLVEGKGKALKECAEELGIWPSTAFLWRHRPLSFSNVTSGGTT